MTFIPAGGGLPFLDRQPYLACNRCSTQYTGSVVTPGTQCVMNAIDTLDRTAPCEGTVIDVGAAIGKLVPRYDPAWWIVTTAENVIRPRWEMPSA